MTSLNPVHKLLAGAAVAALMSTAASASTMTVSEGLDGVFGPNGYSEGVEITNGGDTGNFNAGLFDLESSVLGQFFAFCIDLDNTLSLSATYDMQVPSQISASEQVRIDKLFTKAYADVDTNAEAAGFQLALWEIITDVTLDLGADAFQVVERLDRGARLCQWLPVGPRYGRHGPLQSDVSRHAGQ
jgi:hypothetical protein